jgi:hypothetical protein
MNKFNKFEKKKNILLDLPIDKIVNAFDKFSTELIKSKFIINHKYRGKGVPFIIRWCNKENLISILNYSFKNYKNLDADPENKIRLIPKGLVSHWVAGNVPTLGILSVICSILTKNKSIIKLPSNSDSFFEDIFFFFSKLSPIHKKIHSTLLTLRYDYAEDQDLADMVSKNSDTRIIWGGNKSCEAIINYKKKINVVDMVFHDRTSFIILDEDVIKNELKKITNLVARDISVFEQLACASPHTIFIKTKSKKFILKFCEELSKSLERYLEIFPKTTPTSSQIQSILNLRTNYAINEKVWASKGTEYSIFFDNDIKFGPNIGFRNIFCRTFLDIKDILKVIPKNVQTVGMFVNKKNKAKYMEKLSRNGVLRFKNIGNMTNFEIPWDGIDIPRNLVNYITKI